MVIFLFCFVTQLQGTHPHLNTPTYQLATCIDDDDDDRDDHCVICAAVHAPVCVQLFAGSVIIECVRVRLLHALLASIIIIIISSFGSVATLAKAIQFLALARVLYRPSTN